MKITVLYGGHSAEREVSLRSGRGVARALESRGHQVTLLDPAQPRAELGSGTAGALKAPPAPGEAVQGLAAGPLVSAPAIKDTEVVFIALHGGEGENGTLQALLELAGVAYTGPGMQSSAMAMDKHVSKILFGHAGIPTPAWVLLAPEAPAALDAGQLKALGGFPLVIKPNDGGSTIGLSVIQEMSQFAPAVELSRKYGRDTLIEAFIPGRELSVTVVGEDVYPVIEIRPTHGIYDYECKYTKGMSNYLCPAPLDPPVAREIQELSRRAYHALRCEGAARVDFRLSPEGVAHCLEVNTVPGMTETSLVPMSAQAAGIPFAELVERLCREALDARRRRSSVHV
jgi:D-alanine-D-alanine ligase